MNIFFLDKDPVKAAQYHNDKHAVKMILETAQLLSTAHRVLDGIQYIDNSSGRRIKRWKLNYQEDEVQLYKATHINHPSAVWVRESIMNYDWTLKLFKELCKEYTHRYGKVHKSESLLKYLSKYPKNISNKNFTNPPQAMPDYCKDSDSVTAYRTYYILEKSNMLKYTNRNKPEWL